MADDDNDADYDEREGDAVSEDVDDHSDSEVDLPFRGRKKN